MVKFNYSTEHQRGIISAILTNSYVKTVTRLINQVLSMNIFFNIALLPTDENFVHNCIQLAQANLKDQSTGYLLGEHTYPHVTVCQFTAEHSQLGTIWSSIESMQREPLKLSFGHIYILPGGGIHADKVWVGLTIVKIAALINLQKSIYEKLLQLGIESSTKASSYTPHLTWARCDRNKPITISIMPPPELLQSQHTFSLTIGLSDVNGVYQECLFPSQQPDRAKRSIT
jgi:2'-5' RNA ligase